jgi:hypothetical protein
MIKFLLAISSCILFCQCHFKIYENEHFVSNHVPRTNSDSVSTLSIYNKSKIPCLAVEIGKIVIKPPFEYHYKYDTMVDYAKHTAAWLGGNVVKVKNYRSKGNVFRRQAIFATVYRMDNGTLGLLQEHMDSTSKSYSDSIKDMAIVHIKDYFNEATRPIRFKDSLIGNIRGVGGVFHSRKPVQKDLVFSTNGILAIGSLTLNIKTGNEYFLLLYNGYTRANPGQKFGEVSDKYAFVSKEQWYLLELDNRPF